MVTTDEAIRDARARVAALRGAYDAEVEHLTQLERAPRYIEPNFEDAAVKFRIRLAESARARIYTYAAIRVGDQWYLTGQQTKSYTWDELWAWINKHYLIADSFKVLYEQPF